MLNHLIKRRVNTYSTLIFFGASDSLNEKFQRYLQQSSWEDVPDDPLILFEMVAGSLFEQFDKIVWNVSEVFGVIEHVSFQLLHLRVLVTLANYKTREL